MKRDKSFKFPKPMKVMMASFVNKEQRNAWKNTMIEAMIYGSNMVVNKKKKKKDEEQVES